MPGRAPVVDESPAPPVDIVGRHEKLIARTALISSLTLSSRIIGFAREGLSASMFGDHSVINDAFVTAWRVPNLFRSLLGEGAISTSLQTALTHTDAVEGLEAGRKLFWAIVRVVWWLLFGLCGAMMLAVYFMPSAMPLTGFAWLGKDPGPVRELTIRMMPFVVLVCLSAVAGGALNVRGHFLAPSLAPVLMNVWWIAALFIVAQRFGWSTPAGTSASAEYARQFEMARALATFVLVAGAILLCVQVPALGAQGFLTRSHSAPQHAVAPISTRRVLDVLKSSVPLAVGAAVYQVNVMVDGLMAVGLLADGGPSVLYYATRIQQFPLSLISIAATNAVFPALTALGHRRSLRELRTLHDRTHLAIAFVAIPASIGLFVFAEPVIAACFEHGAFGAAGVARATAALRCLTLAVLPAGAAGLVARTYYALGDFKTPVRISIAMLVSNIALNALFVIAFGMDVGGLALATALTAWGNLFLLLPGLRRLGLPACEPGLFVRLVRITLAALVSTVPARFVYHMLVHDGRSTIALAASILGSIALYAGAAELLAIPEWHHVTARLRKVRHRTA